VNIVYRCTYSKDAAGIERNTKNTYKNTESIVVIYLKLKSECDIRSTADAVSCDAVRRARCG